MYLDGRTRPFYNPVKYFLLAFISALLSSDLDLSDSSSLRSKNIWNYKDLADYTGYKNQTLRNLVSLGEIPHSKPLGGKVFFKRTEIEEWLLKNRISSSEELETKAANWRK